MTKVNIIADVGVNHQGDPTLCKLMVIEAHNAGADYIKFQMFSTIPELRHLEFTPEAWREVFRFCESHRIKWFCTPFNTSSAWFLRSYRQSIWKIPSNPRVIENEALCRLIAYAPSRELTIISTGISGDKDIRRLIGFFDDRPIVIMHCVSKYPTPEDELCLERIEVLKIYGHPVGFSDHSLSTRAAAEAVKLGATWIEKHFTMDRGMDGPDHKASMEPHEFAEMVGRVRDAS